MTLVSTPDCLYDESDTSQGAVEEYWSWASAIQQIHVTRILDPRLMMFRHSVVALAYYDEDGDRLQRRKDGKRDIPRALLHMRWKVGLLQDSVFEV